MLYLKQTIGGDIVSLLNPRKKRRKTKRSVVGCSTSKYNRLYLEKLCELKHRNLSNLLDVIICEWICFNNVFLLHLIQQSNRHKRTI